jgi:sarcosine oxidase subunit alpha
MSAQHARLPQGGQIDRKELLTFTFDGVRYTGYRGDTLASALLANGVNLVGRSFKYHRPRGILSAGAEEPNALVELRSGARREPNLRATQIELYDGLEARSQNRWPSLKYDLLSVNQLAGKLFSAGFYYKTFMWPAKFWEKVYEPLIRRAAGLGRASGVPDPDVYDKATLHCDVLIVGSGIAGLNAALVAGRAGARVVLIEQDHELGGRFTDDLPIAVSREGGEWIVNLKRELHAMPNIEIMTRTSVFSVYDQNVVVAIEKIADHLAEPPPFTARQKMWRIYPRQLIIAAGSLERPIAFADNDRPGVMLAGAVRTYLKRFAVRPGQSAVVFASHDGAALTIEALAAAGVTIAAVVDPRGENQSALGAAAKKAGAPFFADSAVIAARGTADGVTAAEIEGNGRTLSVDCDFIAMSGGWDPVIHLASYLGQKPKWNAEMQAFAAAALPAGMQVAGAAAGAFSAGNACGSGAAAAEKALAAIGMKAKDGAGQFPIHGDEPCTGSLYFASPNRGGKSFVDFQNDVTVDDIQLAQREGYTSVEHTKRYTTLGMATDQGKTSNVVAAGLIAEIRGIPLEQGAVTTFRPPYTAVAIGTVAGRGTGKHFRPTRHSPLHAWCAGKGAVFVEAGPWLRAQYYPQSNGEGWFDAASREARQVRQSVGLCDVSTFGKIDLQGPDAGRFLDFVYINTFSTLPVGKSRYGMMLREDGFVLDDGTVSRLGEHHWLVTTTTANAGRVMQHLEFCAQVLCPDYDFAISSVSDQWAQIAIAGPRARDVLAKIVDGFDLSNEAFPFMGCATVSVCGGIKGRLFRISFSGELAYELAVPAAHGIAVAEALAKAGEPFGVLPYGTEALTMLRVEKGHPAGGELNGQLTARDLGLGKMMSSKKDYIGRVLAGRPALVDPARPILVGLRPRNTDESFNAGSHLLEPDTPRVIENDLGYVTSTAYSPMLGHTIGLGVLQRGHERMGQTVVAYDAVRNKAMMLEVCHPVFYDPENSKVKS